MDLFIYIFFLPVLLIPLWFFLVPPVIVTIVCVFIWKRQALRNTLIVMGIVMCVIIEIPLLGLHMFFSATAGDGRTRLNSHFGSVIDPDSVARHRFKIAGLGDTDDFWKLKHIDVNSCQQIIQKFNLKPIQHDRLFSLMNRPWWWPKSVGPYSVYQGDDGYGGSIELWISKEGYSVYLFKFTE